MMLARVDYKPFNMDNPGNVFAGRKGIQSDIQDFVAGISYQIDAVVCHLFPSHFCGFAVQNVGNCSVVPLKMDMAGDLEIVDGRIQMSDPMHLFHMDGKFAMNGEVGTRKFVGNQTD